VADLTARAREIAAGLTPAQRKWLLLLIDDTRIAPFTKASTDACGGLEDQGLIDPNWDGGTDLGRAVAAVLAGEAVSRG